MYIDEISTRDKRGKALLLLSCGFLPGILFASWFSSSSDEVGWVWQVFIATIILRLLSTYSLRVRIGCMYMRKMLESWERCLAVLRRKKSVAEELRMIWDKEASSDDKVGGALVLKFAVGLMQLLVLELFVGCVIMYLSNTYRSIQDATYTFVNCMGMQLLGAFFLFFVIDRIDHKRSLCCTLVPVAALVFALVYASHEESHGFVMG